MREGAGWGSGGAGREVSESWLVNHRSHHGFQKLASGVLQPHHRVEMQRDRAVDDGAAINTPASSLTLRCWIPQHPPPKP